MREHFLFNEIKEIENILRVLNETFIECEQHGSQLHIKSMNDYIDRCSISSDEKQRLKDIFLNFNNNTLRR